LTLLTRSPVGTSTRIAFVNPGDTAPRLVSLTAVDDGLAPLKASEPFSLTAAAVTSRVLDGPIGYLRIRAAIPTLAQWRPDRAVRRALIEFQVAKVRGVIIDVRGSVGGADKLVTRMMGFFVAERQFYETPTLFESASGRFRPIAHETLWTEPRAPFVDAPVAVLVDPDCISSGEGFALIARRLRRARVVGFHGTYGSFGISGAEIRMPEGLTVEFPDGQSLDEGGVPQLDSDETLHGAVAPDLRVPMTMETARAQFREQRDVVLESAVRALLK
jgi:carboxyl-terminal processing protease